MSEPYVYRSIFGAAPSAPAAPAPGGAAYAYRSIFSRPEEEAEEERPTATAVFDTGLGSDLPPKPAPEVGALRRIARAGARGTLSAVESMASAAEASSKQNLGEAVMAGAGQLMGLPDGLLETLVPAAGARRLLASALRGAAGRAKEASPETFAPPVDAPKDAGEFFGQLRERPVTTLAEAVAESLPGTAAVYASTAVAPPLGLAASYALASGSAREEALASGATPEQAERAAVIAGVPNTLLEYLPSGRLLKRFLGKPGAAKLVREFAMQGLEEGGTEGLQAVVDRLAKIATYAPETSLASPEAFLDYAQQALVGGLTGGALGGVASVAGRAAHGSSEDAPASVPQDAAPEAAADASAAPEPAEPTPPASPREAELVAELSRERERRNLAEREARTDHLTGLMNRRGFEEMQPAAEADPDQHIIEYDLNNFKATNDVAGHAAGDQALRDAAAALRDAVGDRGNVARLGGDEFVQIVRGTREEAEAIRTRTEEAFGANDYGAGALTITGSVGATLAEADAPLQQAKAARKAALGLPLTRAEASAVAPPASTELEAGFVGKKDAAPPRFEYGAKPVEEAFQRSRQGKIEPGIASRVWQRIKDGAKTWSRAYPKLEHGKRFAEAQEGLRRLENAPATEVQRVSWNLKQAFKGLLPDDYELLQRKVEVDSLRGTLRVRPDAKLPNQWTPELLASEGPRVDAQVASNPRVEQAISRLRSDFAVTRGRLSAALRNLGLSDEWLHAFGDDYFHHSYVDRMTDAESFAPGTGGAKQPGWRPHRAQRRGAEGTLNLKYGEVMAPVEAQMAIDATLLEQLARFKRVYSDPVVEQMKAAAKEENAKREAAGTEGRVTWRDMPAPAGYSTWSPARGNVLYSGYTLKERTVQKVLEGATQELVGKDDLRKATMVGAKPMWVLPTELAETLDEYGKAIGPNIRINEELLSKWKAWNLTGNPRRVSRYLFRNVVGDAQKVLQGNPRAFLRVKEAATAIAKHMRGGVPEGDLAAWVSRGGLTAGFFQQEAQQTEERAARRLSDAGRALEVAKQVVTSPIKTYVAITNPVKVYAESVLRYANYLEFAHQMRENNGVPKSFGASIPEEVLGLESVEDRAYWLSNQLVGSYDQISRMGRILRRQLVPFWSFQELNVRSEYRLLRNAVRDAPTAQIKAREAAATVAKSALGKAAGLALKSPLIVARAGKFLALAYAFEGMMAAWNRLGPFADDDDELPEDVRNRAHITFGRDSTGAVLYFDRLSAFEEARRWFGADEFLTELPDYLDGRASAKDVALKILLEPYSAFIGAIGPQKLAFELLTERSLFPNPTRPREITDRVDYLFQNLGLQHEYRLAMGTPDVEYAESWKQTLLYRVDPGVADYYDSLAIRDAYLKQNEDRDLRQDALRRWKQAVRFERPEIAERYRQLYYERGGTDRGIEQSIARLHPLYGVPKEDRDAYLEGLPEEDRATVEGAIAYWEETYASEGGR